MQEVELLDGDEDVAEQPAPPARTRRAPVVGPGRRRGGGAVARRHAAGPRRPRGRGGRAARRRPRGRSRRSATSSWCVRTISRGGADELWAGSRSAARGRPASSSRRTGRSRSRASTQRTGETLWSTPLLGPDADRAASRGEQLRRRLPGRRVARRAGDGRRVPGHRRVRALRRTTGREERFPATTSQVVVLDTDDGHVITEWDVEADLAARPRRRARRGGHPRRGARRGGRRARRDRPATSSGATRSPSTHGARRAARGVLGAHGRRRRRRHVRRRRRSPSCRRPGPVIRDDLRAASRDAGFATDPVTGTFAITSYASGSARTTTLLAPRRRPGRRRRAAG